jgi:uncharacterized small protein (DUF1192 family)
MAMVDDEPKPKRSPHVVGEDVSLLSAAELEIRIGMLKAEIERLEVERTARGATRNAAEALFRR